MLGIEARGFIFGPVLADRLGAGFAPVRKPHKLPAETASVTYDLEYGTDTLDLHRDAIQPGQRVLIVDDLLATGGTSSACVQLVRELGGVVAGLAVAVELEFLNGRSKLTGCGCLLAVAVFRLKNLLRHCLRKQAAESLRSVINRHKVTRLIQREENRGASRKPYS